MKDHRPEKFMHIDPKMFFTAIIHLFIHRKVNLLRSITGYHHRIHIIKISEIGDWLIFINNL